jgi:hypothetical protein
MWLDQDKKWSEQGYVYVGAVFKFDNTERDEFGPTFNVL